ncbi:MAG: hypothetical protein NVSMB56_18110 [Pyrinomonadaceae bacterium]
MNCNGALWFNLSFIGVSLQKMFHTLLNAIALLCALLPLFAALWIVLPAPFYRLWLVSVAASEWGFWLALMTFLGVGVLAFQYRVSLIVALAASVLTIGLALVPYLQSRNVARANKVELSLQRYFGGFVSRITGDNSPKVNKQTVTYTVVDLQPLQLDIYRTDSDKNSKPKPALIVIHGGYWMAGERSDFPQWDEWFARHNFVVFDIDYRLAPQPNWQASIGDVKCAIAWVKRHAPEFDVDANRIALFGRSAGGHLALLAAYSPAEPRLAPSCDTEGVDTNVRAVIAFYAPTDLIWGYDNPFSRIIDNRLRLRNYLGGDSDTARDTFALMSPISYVGSPDSAIPHVTSKPPPTLLFHGGRDQLVNPEHMPRLAAILDAAHVAHREISIPYGQQGLDYNFYGWGSQIAQPVILDFLRTHLAAQ